MSLIRHGAQYLVARGVPAVVNFLAIAVYTRLLSPSDYGIYVLGLATATVGNALFFQWLHLGIIRYWARYSDRPLGFLSTVAVGFAASAAAVTVAAGLVFFLAGDAALHDQIPLVLLLLLVWAFMELNLALRNAQTRPRDYGILATARSVLALAIGSTLAFMHGNASAPLWGWVIGMSAALGFLAIRDWRHLSPRRADPLVMRRLLRYGAPLTASLALAMVVGATDRFLLAYLRGTEEAGLYAAGYDLAAQILTVLMMIVSLAAYPLIVRALETQGQAAARRELSNHAVALFGISIPAALGLMLLARPLAHLVLGREFQQAAENLIPIIAFASLLAGAKAYYFDYAFQLGQKTLGQVWVLLAAATLNVVLNLALIPTFGIQGAAWSTVAAYGLGLLLSIAYGRRWFKLPFPLGAVLKILLAGAVMSAAVWPLREQEGVWGFALAAFIGVATFAIAALALNIRGLRQILLQRLPGRSPGR